MKFIQQFKPSHQVMISFMVLIMTILSSSTLFSGDNTEHPSPEQQNSVINSEGEKTYQFTYKFKANQILKYSVNHTTAVDTSKGEFSELNKNESITQMHYRVVSVDSSQNAILEPVLDHVKMTANFANADPITYDSKVNEKSPAQFSGVDQSIGKPLSRYKFNNSGKLLQILDLRNADKNLSNKTNNENNSVSLLGNHNFLILFPDHPIKIGEKWNEKYEVSLKISEALTKPVQFIRKYELESVNNNQATINLKTILASIVEDPKLRLQLIQKAPTGKVIFDMNQGVVISREFDIDQTEFGIFGKNSKIHVTSKRIEQQIN